MVLARCFFKVGIYIKVLGKWKNQLLALFFKLSLYIFEADPLRVFTWKISIYVHIFIYNSYSNHESSMKSENAYRARSRAQRFKPLLSVSLAAPSAKWLDESTIFRCLGISISHPFPRALITVTLRMSLGEYATHLWKCRPIGPRSTCVGTLKVKIKLYIINRRRGCMQTSFSAAGSAVF